MVSVYTCATINLKLSKPAAQLMADDTFSINKKNVNFSYYDIVLQVSIVVNHVYGIEIERNLSYSS